MSKILDWNEFDLSFQARSKDILHDLQVVMYGFLLMRISSRTIATAGILGFDGPVYQQDARWEERFRREDLDK